MIDIRSILELARNQTTSNGYGRAQKNVSSVLDQNAQNGEYGRISIASVFVS